MIFQSIVKTSLGNFMGRMGNMGLMGFKVPMGEMVDDVSGKVYAMVVYLL